ncbi:hypothetical protein [Streptomyces sp. WZ-12]|uniref:hypothetical protein n=1 Tax=Streptomyces sp. WZ-12 TaxID=3030210 RepID=UPI002380E5B4|nr:hypothetical protein [Streptomyces sp. WZ-12]
MSTAIGERLPGRVVEDVPERPQDLNAAGRAVAPTLGASGEFDGARCAIGSVNMRTSTAPPLQRKAERLPVFTSIARTLICCRRPAN